MASNTIKSRCFSHPPAFFLYMTAMPLSRKTPDTVQSSILRCELSFFAYSPFGALFPAQDAES